jgi:serine/threonine protein phosphatase 1
LAKSRPQAALPLIIEVMTEGKKVVICHADYPHNEYAYDKPVDAEQVIWNRERVSAAQDGIVNEISGADLFIFGHTPTHQPSQYANQMYIDTGAVFCGLTLVQIQGGDHA